MAGKKGMKSGFAVLDKETHKQLSSKGGKTSKRGKPKTK